MNEEEGKVGRVRERARVLVSEEIRETATTNFRGKEKGKGDEKKAINAFEPRLSPRLMPDVENIPAHFTFELLIMGN